ncbi:MAG: hypothetical protein FWD05_03720 [Oscillospiraceae bacterium]|nr:hypothetical protein [Oscillospiraceae bacterium]
MEEIVMRPAAILFIILGVIIFISLFGLIFSIIGAITSLILRFIFGPLGLIALIILVIYLLKNGSPFRK